MSDMDGKCEKVFDVMVDENRVLNTLGKMEYYLNNHNSILCSVSGGSDSDIIVHMIAIYFRKYLDKIHFVFVNTGLEYQATKDHLDYLEYVYRIKIDRIRGMSVVTAVRQYGAPIISKEHSHHIKSFCNDAPSAIKKVMGLLPNKSHFNFTEKPRALAIACKERGIKISDMCCNKSKKEPLAHYCKANDIDLSITGERRAEGGQRAIKHSSCFEPNTSHGYDKYMPLFFWDDDTKAWYKEQEGIQYSDCYEVWGMTRTGCVGCPFNSKVGAELQIIKEHEPNLYKACLNVFGESYRLMDEFHIRRVPILKGLEEE